MPDRYGTTSAVVAVVSFLISESLSIRLIMLDVPSPTVVGESVEMTCSFDMQHKKLYAVKWYKNNVEFYRYVPSNYPPNHVIPMPGVRVDLSKSNEHYVYLRYIDLNTSGMYRCEVSADEPYFDVADSQKEMKVLVLPTEGPKITGGRQRYQVGETVLLNCTSVKSKPAAILKWYINDDAAGAEYEKEYSEILHTDGLETSWLTLRFVVSEKHFKKGNMRLKCTATISRLYTMSDEENAFLGKRQNSGFQIDEAMWQTRGDTTKSRGNSVSPFFGFLALMTLFLT